jgi:hypothetical protein
VIAGTHLAGTHLWESVSTINVRTVLRPLKPKRLSADSAARTLSETLAHVGMPEMPSRHERSDALFAVSFNDVAAQSLALFLVGRHKILSLDPSLRKDTPFSFR